MGAGGPFPAGSDRGPFSDGFPGQPPTRLSQKVEWLRAKRARLTPIVGDPEDVVDEHGWLPRAQREQTWWSYRLATRNLDRLIAEGPFTAADMCSECATPTAHHG